MTGYENAIRVVLADDHHFSRDGLRGMLAADGIAVVGEATDRESAVRLANELAPDLVAIDLSLPEASGIDALRQIVARSPDAQVLLLSASSDEAEALEALAAGACGYLLKDASAEELVGAIRLAAGGHGVLSRDVLRALAARVRTDVRAAEQASEDAPTLTERELQVVRLITQGADNATIGRELS
ncbi:MAG: response regulator, partial [Solirubrobacteraceae bacterium]